MTRGQTESNSGTLAANSPCRRSVGVSLLLLCVATAFGIWVANRTATRMQPVGEGRGLVCQQPTHDYGAVPLQAAAKLEHRFVLRNTADCPVRVVKQTSGCSCTVAAISDKLIPPGGALEVAVSTDWSGRAGRQLADIVLTTDYAPNRHTVLSMTGWVKSPAVVSPARISFGLLRPGQQAARMVEVAEGTDSRPFRITQVTVSSQLLAVARVNEQGDETPAVPLEGAPGRFVVKIAAPDVKPATNEASVVFHTDLVELPVLELIVRMGFEEILTATPASLFFAGRDDEAKTTVIRRQASVMGSSPEAQIIWQSPDPNPFYVDSVRTEGQQGEAKVLVTVGCKKAMLKPTVSRAVLRVRLGSDLADVPIIALNSSRR